MLKRTELRRLRRARDLTLFDVSEATGIAEPRLSRVERGQAQPRPDEAEALAAFFRKPFDVLMAEPSAEAAA